MTHPESRISYFGNFRGHEIYCVTHPESRIRYFGNFRGHEIYCIEVPGVWALVDLRTVMTHRSR